MNVNKKTEGYAKMYIQKQENNTNIKSHANNSLIKKGIDFDKIKNWDDISITEDKKEKNNLPDNDDYSVNTSNFTNRFEIGNNVDKIELSNLYIQNDKKININSVDNFTMQINKHDAFDVIEEKEENHVSDITQDVNLRNNLKDSLEDSGFKYKNYDSFDITRNQLNEINKELHDIQRSNNIKTNTNQNNNSKPNQLRNSQKNIYYTVDHKEQNSPVKKNPTVKRRKQSPYVRNNEKQQIQNNTPYLTDQNGKPISIQTYQQNTNIVHYQQPNIPIYFYPPNMQNPMYNLPLQSMSNIPIQNINNMQLQTPPIQNVNSMSNMPIYPMYYQPIQDIYNNPQNKQNEYKPYSLKDYKEKFSKTPKNERGGLGANIGTKDWNEKAKKKEKMKEYSKDLKKNKLEPIIVKEKKMDINNKNNIKKIDNIINPLDNSEEINDSMLYDLLESKVPYERIAKEYKNKQIKKEKSEEKKENNHKKTIQNSENRLIYIPNEEINKTDDKSIDTSKSGYSHIHNIRKLKNESHRNLTPVSSNKVINIKNRPNSLKKIENKDSSKIYTTINHTKLRPISTKTKKDPEIKNIEIENLIQNHMHYRDKIESIRKYINKI